LFRAEVGVQPALGQARGCGERADGQAPDPHAGGFLDGAREDRLAGALPLGERRRLSHPHKIARPSYSADAPPQPSIPSAPPPLPPPPPPAPPPPPPPARWGPVGGVGTPRGTTPGRSPEGGVAGGWGGGGGGRGGGGGGGGAGGGGAGGWGAGALGSAADAGEG